MPLWVGRRLGPYEVLAPLGAGGMGEVYKARDTRLGRDVAIKILPAEFASDPERLRRFEREARAAAALNHPNILVLYDIGSTVLSLRGVAGQACPEEARSGDVGKAISSSTPGLPRPLRGLAVTGGEGEAVHYIVTELLDGENLRQRLRGGPLPPAKAVEFGVQIAQGLAAAHEKGIVHRDLKPGNLFVTKEGRVKILDFGLARLRQQEASTPEGQSEAATADSPTREGRILGTPGYMAPEQVRGRSVDARTDLFAFGVVLYEMLAGKRAFAGGTAADTQAAILSKDPDPLPPVTPQSLDRVVRRCLEKRPEDRFQSAHDLALALEVAAGSGMGASRLRRWVLIAGAATGILLVAAIPLGIRHLRQSPAPPTADPTAPSVAVLPFTNLSGDKEQEYFSDGLSEDVMGLLTKVKELHVAGHTSSFAFKGKSASLAEIGRQLHVATVLEGSVRRSGDRLRVTAELINVADGYQLWAETYDRTMNDVFSVQDDIAGAVVAALKVTLLTQEHAAHSRHTTNPEAYTQYLLGRHFYSGSNPESWHRAIEAYEAAIKLDPTYAAAYAGLAVAETDLAAYCNANTEIAERVGRAGAASEKAIALDPTLADAFWARGHMRTFVFPPDWTGAETDLERALVLDPISISARIGLSYLLGLEGRMPKALAEIKKAIDLDPLSGMAWQTLGWELYFDGDLEGARKALTRAIDINPEDALSHYFLGVTLILSNRPNDAMAEFARTLEVFHLQGIALAEHDLGRRKESQQALDELIAKYADNCAFQVAEVYAWRGEKDEALEWLERAYRQRDWGLFGLKVTPTLRKLRADPRYLDLVRQMNVPEHQP